MKVSNDELFIKTRLALNALGFSFGMDHAAARVITCMEYNKLSGINYLVAQKNVLQRDAIRAPLAWQQDNGLMTIDCAHTPALAFADRVAQLATVAYGQKILTQILIKNTPCAVPIFISLMDQYGQDFAALKLCRVDEQQGQQQKTVIAEYNNAQIACEKSAWSSDTLSNNTSQWIIDIDLPCEFQRTAFRDHCDLDDYLDGYDVAASNWGDIIELALQTLVPETEESRRFGAGGGDAND